MWRCSGLVPSCPLSAGTSVATRSGDQQPARILDEGGIDAERQQLLGLADVVGVRMHGAVRIDEPARNVEAVPLGRPDRDLEVAHVVERIVGRMVAHAVGSETLGRQLDHVVGKELEGEEALSPRVDDERRVLHP